MLALVVAVAVPISQTAAGEENASFRISSAGLAEALGVPAGPLTGALTDTALSGASGNTYLQRVTPLLAINLIPQPLLGPTGRLVGDALPELAAFAGPYATFSVYQDGLATSYSSALPTVGEALADAGVSIGPGDTVYPDPNSAMTPGLHVFVDHATAVTLIVAGEERDVYTHALTVRELLNEQSVDVQATDIVSARMGLTLRNGMTVKVTTVRKATEYDDIPIPFRTVYSYDANVFAGKDVIKQAGEPGHMIRESLVTRVDGEESTSEILSETLKLPVDQIVAIGTYVPPTPAPTPQPVFAVGPGQEITCAGGMLHVWATWYTAASSGGSGITKTGTAVYKGIIAVDPAIIPLGTHIYVPGYGFGIAADTGGGIKGNKIDLGYGPDDAKDWHTGHADICIIG